MKSAFFSLLTVAIFVYACFCIYLFLFQRSFIYFPTPAAEGVPADELSIANDGETIRVWSLHAAQTDAIIYFGGNAEDVSQNVVEFAGYFPQQAIYLPNYRGYGGSTGSPGEAAFHSDARAMFDHVKERHRYISVIGRSLGAAIAVNLAICRDVHRLALVTPFDSLGSLARDLYPIFPTSLLLKDRYDAIGAAGLVRAPALIVVAEHDEIIPRRSSDRLAHALAGPSAIRVIEGTGHNTIGMSPEYGRALQAFLADRAAGASDQ
jgi:hypothetical protein